MLPFLNRERYIVLKCYTFTTRLAEQVPIVSTSQIKPRGVCPHTKDSVVQADQNLPFDFSTCFGWTKTKNTSLTMRYWSELRIEGHNLSAPAGNFTETSGTGHDPVYDPPKGLEVLKLLSPWQCESNKPDINFVHTKHILNTTPMDIISGVNAFGNYLYSSNIFYRSRATDSYKVSFKEPLIALYPQSDLPVHAECYHDVQKYNTLLNTQNITRPYFRGVGIKDSLFHKK